MTTDLRFARIFGVTRQVFVGARKLSNEICAQN